MDRLGVTTRLLSLTDSLLGPEWRLLDTSGVLGTVAPESAMPVGVVLVQSAVGYSLGYLVGTAVHVWSGTPQRASEDTQQPWGTIVRRLTFGDELTVVTREGTRLRGRLARLGFPSESADLLLWGTVELRDETVEPLGMVFLHERSLARVELDVKPDGGLTEGNWLVRGWGRLTGRVRSAVIGVAARGQRLVHEFRHESSTLCSAYSGYSSNTCPMRFETGNAPNSSITAVAPA